MKASEIAKNTIKGGLWVFGIVLAGSVANEDLPFGYQVYCSTAGVILLVILAWFAGANFGIRGE